jgi:hypothetical protein
MSKWHLSTITSYKNRENLNIAKEIYKCMPKKNDLDKYAISKYAILILLIMLYAIGLYTLLILNNWKSSIYWFYSAIIIMIFYGILRKLRG